MHSSAKWHLTPSRFFLLFNIFVYYISKKNVDVLYIRHFLRMRIRQICEWFLSQPLRLSRDPRNGSDLAIFDREEYVKTIIFNNLGKKVNDSNSFYVSQYLRNSSISVWYYSGLKISWMTQWSKKVINMPIGSLKNLPYLSHSEKMSNYMLSVWMKLCSESNRFCQHKLRFILSLFKDFGVRNCKYSLKYYRVKWHH